MACRHVDDVIVGAPAEVTRDLIATFDVRAVVAESGASVPEPERRNRARDDAPAASGGNIIHSRDEDSFREETRARVIQKRDPNEIAKTLGVFREVPPPAADEESGADRLRSSEFVRRVAAARGAYEARNARKNQSEARYYEQKSNRTIELARET